jgi:regulator of sirC expression with transglutaminase-like and TPR domain
LFRVKCACELQGLLDSKRGPFPVDKNLKALLCRLRSLLNAFLHQADFVADGVVFVLKRNMSLLLVLNRLLGNAIDLGMGTIIMMGRISISLIGVKFTNETLKFHFGTFISR